VLHGKTTDHIHLSLTADGSYAHFTVTDTGQGIPDQELPHLVSGTIRSGSAARGGRKRNMGLGLSVCLAIVRAHGGTMTAKNLPNGAEFTFCLPLEP